MDKSNTRERILEVALDLFSVRGYSAVSIRDIGKVINIKESSIYYHFTNKQQIYDELIKRAYDLVDTMKHVFQQRLELTETIAKEAFVAVAVNYLDQFFLNDTVIRIIHMLTIEKQSNQQAAKAYESLLFDAPITQQSSVFSYLMERNLMKKDHMTQDQKKHDLKTQDINPDQNRAKLLATEYQALMLYIFNRYFSDQNYSVQVKSEAEQELSMLMEGFYIRNFSGDSKEI